MDVQLTCYIGAGRVKAAPMRAITENISRDGMLMRWVDGIPLPAIDKKLTLDVPLPENSEFGPRVMRCDAQVVRITRCTDKTHAVGLKVLGMRFIRTRRPAVSRDLASMPVPMNRVI